MKKTFVGLALTFVFALLTGCAAPNQPTLEQTYGVGVVTQSRQVASYAVAPQTIQQSKIIPYTYVGQPNVIHYLDTSNMPATQTATYSVPLPSVPQNTYYNNSNSTYGSNSYNYGNNNYNRNTTYTVDQYGNRVVNNNYSNGNYQNNNSGVAYVAPTTQAPAYGYEWRYNNRYGWAWYHPQYGWYLSAR